MHPLAGVALLIISGILMLILMDYLNRSNPYW